MSKIHHEKLEHKHPEHKKAGKESYFWIKLIRENGRVAIWGYRLSKEEAERVASKVNVSYEIIELETADESEATRLIKGKSLEKSGDLEMAIKRVSHKKE